MLQSSAQLKRQVSLLYVYQFVQDYCNCQHCKVMDDNDKEAAFRACKQNLFEQVGFISLNLQVRGCSWHMAHSCVSSHSTGPQIQDKSLTKCLGVLWTTFFNPFSQRKIYLSINFTKFQMFLEHESM